MLPKWEGSTEKEEAQRDEAWNSFYDPFFHALQKTAEELHRTAETWAGDDSELVSQIRDVKEDAQRLYGQREAEKTRQWQLWWAAQACTHSTSAAHG